MGPHRNKLQPVIQISFMDLSIDPPMESFGLSEERGVLGRTHWSCHEVCVVGIFLDFFMGNVNHLMGERMEREKA